MLTQRLDYKSEMGDRFMAKAKGEDVLLFLGARGIAISDEARDEISRCTDIAQLDTWITRAAVVDTIEELLRD